MNQFAIGLLAIFISQVAAADGLRAKAVTLEGVIDHNSSSRAPVLLQAKVPVYEVYSSPVQETQPCTRVVCQDIPGNGIHGDWKGFFEAPHAERAKRLADAIKGVGMKSATLMVQYGFFSTKPRTWNAFVSEIKSAERTLVSRGFKGHFAEQVTELYGSENAHSLGYYSTASCQDVQTSCTVWVEHEFEKFAYNVDRTIELQVKGAVLQSFESEKYTIKVGLEPNSVQVGKPSYYNTYAASVTPVSSNFTRVKLEGISRNRVELPADAGKASLYKSTEGLKLTASMDPKFMPKADDASSVLKFVYRVCRTNIFGGCHEELLPWSPELVRSTNFELTVRQSLLKKGSKYKVWYKIIRSGSRYYNEEVVTQTSDSVKF